MHASTPQTEQLAEGPGVYPSQGRKQQQGAPATWPRSNSAVVMQQSNTATQSGNQQHRAHHACRLQTVHATGKKGSATVQRAVSTVLQQCHCMCRFLMQHKHAGALMQVHPPQSANMRAQFKPGVPAFGPETGCNQLHVLYVRARVHMMFLAAQTEGQHSHNMWRGAGQDSKPARHARNALRAHKHVIPAKIQQLATIQQLLSEGNTNTVRAIC